MFRFLAQKRFFKVPLTLGMPAPYMYDLLSLLFVGAAVPGCSDLSGIRRRSPLVTLSPRDFILIGSLGLYGVRLSMWIAILRKNRIPQTAEWLAAILPLVGTLICLIFSGQMVRAYAGDHGYYRCADQHDQGTLYVYAAPACPSPAQPPGSTRS